MRRSSAATLDRVGLLVARRPPCAAALVATTTATSADAIPVSNPAHPVIDTNWIYDHNFFESNTFIYKVAGSDGCLPSATTCARAAARAGDVTTCRRTTTARRSSTPGGRASARRTRRSRTASSACGSRRVTISSRRAAGSSNDAELTIPGAVCAGQQVMLASHNDSTPVSTRGGPSSASGRQPHADDDDALGQLGQRLGLRRQHGREHEPGGDRVGAPLARGQRHLSRPARSRRPSTTTRRAAWSAPATTRRPAPRRRSWPRRPRSATRTSRSPRPPTSAGTTIALDEVNTENPTVAVGRHGGDEHDARRRRQRPATRRSTSRASAGIAVGHNLNVGLSNVDTEQRRRGRDRTADGHDARGGRLGRRHEHQGRLGHEHGRRREGRGRRRLRQRGVPHDHGGRNRRRDRHGRHARLRALGRARQRRRRLRTSAAASP